MTAFSLVGNLPRRLPLRERMANPEPDFTIVSERYERKDFMILFIMLDKIRMKKLLLITLIIISVLYWPRIKILTKLSKTAYACVIIDKAGEFS